MTYTDAVSRIAALDHEIAEWQGVYRRLRLELEEADREVLSRMKEKWRLERDIIPVVKLPTYAPRKRSISAKAEEIDLDKMTLGQVEEMLRVLKARERNVNLSEIEED